MSSSLCSPDSCDDLGKVIESPSAWRGSHEKPRRAPALLLGRDHAVSHHHQTTQRGRDSARRTAPCLGPGSPSTIAARGPEQIHKMQGKEKGVLPLNHQQQRRRGLPVHPGLASSLEGSKRKGFGCDPPGRGSKQLLSQCHGGCCVPGREGESGGPAPGLCPRVISGRQIHPTKTCARSCPAASSGRLCSTLWSWRQPQTKAKAPTANGYFAHKRELDWILPPLKSIQGFGFF